MGNLNLITAIFSLIAAILWLTSTFFRLNKKNGIGMRDMAEKMEKQSRFNAWAAASATIAAISQSIIFFCK